jgi:NADH-quinone oxidoreductase subunit J
MTEQIAFGLITTLMFFSGVMVVTGKNLVHCVLWLAVTLLGTAALYVLLSAPFLAGVQVLLYTGGIITLMLFGVMLTHRHHRLQVENEQSGKIAGATAASVIFGILATAVFQTDAFPPAGELSGDTADLGRAIFTEHLLAFEVLSLLLLAAMIGAIVLARPKDFRLALRPLVRPTGVAPAAPDTAGEGAEPGDVQGSEEETA